MATDDYRARLIAARERLGLSRREMAKRLLTPRVTYEQWEAAARRTPGVAVVAAERVAEMPARLSAMRGRVLKLADGTRSGADIAEILGISVTRVHACVYAIRQAGNEITLVRQRQQRQPEHASRDAAISAGIQAGRTYADLGRQYGLTREALRQIADRLGIQSGAAKNRAIKAGVRARKAAIAHA